MSMQIIIDVLVLCLLAAACGYCTVLSKRLRTMRDSQSELLKYIQKFDEASVRSQRNLALLQENSAIVSGKISKKTREAEALLNELSVIVETSDHIANRIEAATHNFRNADSSTIAKKREAA